MKSNLDQFYKTDKKLEDNGVDFEVADNVRIRIKRFSADNPSVKEAMNRLYKPYAKVIETGAMPPEKAREITVKVFVECCVVAWEGVELDGKIAEFTKANAIKLLVSLPSLTDALMDYAGDYRNFKEDDYKEDLGNS